MVVPVTPVGERRLIDFCSNAEIGYASRSIEGCETLDESLSYRESHSCLNCQKAAKGLIASRTASGRVITASIPTVLQ